MSLVKVRNNKEKWICVALVSGVSIMASLLITSIASPTGLSRTSFIPAFFVPLLVAPAASLWCAEMILRIHELNLELERLLLHDHMTGLLNRRAFFEFVASNRDSDGGPVMLIDIDHFKSINDTHGHHVGDEVIKMVANIMKQVTGEEGKAARLGGEEFGIYMPDATLEGGMTRADQIRTAVENQKLTMFDEPVGCTLSVGVDYLPQDDDVDEALQRADKALYDAKGSGRNRVVRYRPDAAAATG